MVDILIAVGKAFLVGGALCLIGQLLIDYTKLSPAKILVSFLLAGIVLGALGWYPPLIEWAGAGATVPLTGFGAMLAKGMQEAIAEEGAWGILTGGLTAAAAGVATAIVSAVVVAVICRPGDKS